MVDAGEIAFEKWRPSRYAVAFERLDPPEHRSRPSRIVRHGSWPFLALAAADGDRGAQLQRVAHRYLTELDAHLAAVGYAGGLGLPAGWLAALDPQRDAAELAIGWLPVWPSFAQGESERPPRLGSWRLLRASAAADGAPWQGTVILVAAETLSVGEQPLFVNRDIGVRVPITLAVGPDGVVQLVVRSMTAELPFGDYHSLTELGAEKIAGEIEALETLLRDEDRIACTISAKLQLDRASLIRDDIRLRWECRSTSPTLKELEIRGKGRSTLSSDGRPLGSAFRATFDGPADDLTFRTGSTPCLSTAAAPAPAPVPGEARVFRQDPASWRDRAQLGAPGVYDWSLRRPTRTDDVLDRFRELVTIGDPQPAVLEGQSFRVMKCPDFVREDHGHGVKSVDLPAGQWPAVRRNDFTAIMAYAISRDVFRLIEGLDIDLGTFFVAALDKVDIDYRSGIKPGPGKDGRTINARVSLEPEVTDDGVRTRIEVHLALGELSRWARPLDRPPGSRWAEPLGIADAERWMWHELGHVLIAARLGQLELDFVHSIGDGLAAVKADPFSRLGDPTGEAMSISATSTLPFPRRLRGFTFPWVFIPRRHDRSVRMGWAWGGTLNRSLLDAPEDDRRDRKAYITEQILSSTLFRLYLILGGDTVRPDGTPNEIARQRASTVTLFLVIEALRMMAQSPSAAAALEQGMEAADIARALPLPLPRNVLEPGEDPTLPVAWTGGAARKVVRWAFEAQGMFSPNPSVNHNAPGLPPQVDIYIPDLRPLREPTENGWVEHGPGGYVPVSLDWNAGASGRRWQNDPAALGNGFAPAVTIRNRGREPASGISLRWWVGVATGDPDAPDWETGDQITWLLTGAEAIAGDVAPGASRTATPSIGLVDTSSHTGSLVVMVEVSCPDDRANSAPEGLLACAIAAGAMPPTVPMALADLVANDNNLGLWMRPLPA